MIFLENHWSESHELGGIVCRLPKNVGYACGHTTPHSAYYFDSDIRECIEFMFEGCGGNQNRFSTKEECMEGCRSLTLCGKGMPLMDFAGNIKRCDGERVPCPGSHECLGNGMNSVCCQKADRICQSSVHPGTLCGVPAATRFYFDSSSKTCRPFAFTGCGGNENNFKTKGECMTFCNNEIICARGDPHADRYSINNIASCMENKHCPRNYTCTAKPTSKKGACCPSKEFVCGTPFEARNNCRKHEPQTIWWFDYRKGECRQSEHSNCEEHFNSFANQEQCSDYCIGTCPNGLDVHLNPRTGQPHLCDSAKNLGCPMGYECLKSSPYASICCRTHPICPSAESILQLDAESHVAVRCDPSRGSTDCAEHHTCQQARNLEHVCCTQPLECPSGMAALREDGGRPRICSPHVAGTCPLDHLCTLAATNSRHLCCAPRQKCVNPYVDAAKKRAVRCAPGGTNACPPATICLPAIDDDDVAKVTNAIDVAFYCCHVVNVLTCNGGGQPLLDTNTGAPIGCHPPNPASCPSEHSCQALIDGTYACCPIEIATCHEALVDAESGSPIGCRGWDDNGCPSTEAKCQKALDGRYYCCRGSPPLLLLNSAAHVVPQVEGIVAARPLFAIRYTPRGRLRRTPDYLRLIEERRRRRRSE